MRKYINEYGEHMVEMTLEELGPITDEEREMAKQARNMPQNYDSDCLPLSEAMRKRAEEMIVARKKMRASTPVQNEEIIARMVNQLWETGRSKDAKRAEKDRDYRNKLIAEFRTAQPMI